jgi:hypothetical protein
LVEGQLSAKHGADCKHPHWWLVTVIAALDGGSARGMVNRADRVGEIPRGRRGPASQSSELESGRENSEQSVRLLIGAGGEIDGVSCHPGGAFAIE